MDEKTEHKTHELVLAVISQGRLWAQEWREVGLVPQGSTRSFVPSLLNSLCERSGLEDIDDERIGIIGEQIRHFTNDYRSGMGDQALVRYVDTEHFFDVKRIDLVNLAWRWRQVRKAKRALDDKLAAIRETERLLAEI
ncbi:hypothetical protein [Epibacterium ulvae]|uniref:hypothetical protein n=1 Tax=Epibacterium ulvae TaxID=1156985 RepID=UPI002491915D|nr:hypothetical protein [Epibacterium ulvae]